jgi:Ser/Thr protein kinase RdoA (MazF antagonist)
MPCVIRQGRPFASLLGIDRARESEVLRRIHHLGIGPEVLGIDLERDQTVFRAIPGVTLNRRHVTPAVLAQGLTVLSRLHGQPSSEETFAASSLIRHYLRSATLPPVLLEFCEQQAALASRLERSARLVLCHNDCVAKNWILAPDGSLRLIDFEFSAPNDPAFDLATWCLDFGITPRDPVMTAYENWEPDLEQRVRRYFTVVDTLWALYCHCLAQWTSGRVQQTAMFQLRLRLERLAVPLHFRRQHVTGRTTRPF